MGMRKTSKKTANVDPWISLMERALILTFCAALLVLGPSSASDYESDDTAVLELWSRGLSGDYV